MANTRFSYVKQFEQESLLLPSCWPLVRVDGRSFTGFSKRHHFRKPSEPLALGVMNAAAAHVMSTFEDIVLAYGHSDEYRYVCILMCRSLISFLLRQDTRMYNRRLQKILSSIVSAFSSAYCFHWSTFFPNQPLQSLPTFDGRIVLYPRFEHVVDYFSWRHADCHINTQYNICFWCLVADGKTPDEAYTWLKHTNKGDKNEYIFNSRAINYNDIPKLFRKGTTLVRLSVEDAATPLEQDAAEKEKRAQHILEPKTQGTHTPAKEVTPDANNCDVIALIIDEAELNQIHRKTQQICQEFRVGVVYCDNISSKFWKIVSPGYTSNRNQESSRPGKAAPSIASLTHEDIAFLNANT